VKILNVGEACDPLVVNTATERRTDRPRRYAMAEMEKKTPSIAASPGDLRGRTPGTETRSGAGDKPAAPKAKRRKAPAKSAPRTKNKKKTAAKAASGGKTTSRRSPRTGASSGAKTKPGRSATITPEERRQLIAEAAYYRAEKRGFHGGSPEADWFEAEAEIDAKLLE
jgi:hypothetical protein